MRMVQDPWTAWRLEMPRTHVPVVQVHGLPCAYPRSQIQEKLKNNWASPSTVSLRQPYSIRLPSIIAVTIPKKGNIISYTLESIQKIISSVWKSQVSEMWCPTSGAVLKPAHTPCERRDSLPRPSVHSNSQSDSHQKRHNHGNRRDTIWMVAWCETLRLFAYPQPLLLKQILQETGLGTSPRLACL